MGLDAQASPLICTQAVSKRPNRQAERQGRRQTCPGNGHERAGPVPVGSDMFNLLYFVLDLPVWSMDNRRLALLFTDQCSCNR